MTALSSEGLEKAVAQAIFDPGATEGYKGDRTLTEWQVQAVMRAITSHTPALPPVDGLEVVAWRYRSNEQEPWQTDHAWWAQVRIDEMRARYQIVQPLATISQASSVIAGLRAELVDVHTRLGELIEEDKHAWAKHVATEIVLGQQKAKTEAAEARISSLEEENKRLREALSGSLEALQAAEERDDRARFRANSPRMDAVVVHLRTSAIRSARQALEDHNG
jgi:hypothetical protein